MLTALIKQNEMTRQDELWKAAIEEFFVDFLAFFYPELLPKIDFSQEFDFLDKDLPKLFPKAEEIDRKADRIVKIPLVNGKIQWLIIHVEVQGYKDPNFARRMFTYYYRLADRFDVPIATLVIYSDKNQQNRVTRYEASCLNTHLVYEFDTYVIADHTEEEYESIQNPFAIIFQTALLGIMVNKKDEELLEMKIQLFRKLLEKGYDKKRIQLIATFIKEYIRFAKPEYYVKFDKRSEELTKDRKNMGIIETVIRYRSEDARKEGREEGIELAAYLNNFEYTIQSILKPLRKGFTVKDIALLTEIKESIVKEVEVLIPITKEKVLIKKIEKIRTNSVSIKYSMELLKIDLIQLLLTFKFSEKTISKILKCPLGLINKIKKTN